MSTAAVVNQTSINPKVAGILSKFVQVRTARDGWIARCPAHEDRNPSLSVAERDGKVLLHCHAGCTTQAVCDAAGIEIRDLFEDKPGPRIEGRIEAQYDYTDEHGKLLFQTVRYEPKDFKQRQPGRDGWIWNLQGVRRVLYRLPEVLAASEVLVSEGEKDCETARVWRLVATCNPMGAGKWREEYSEPLRGKHVTVIADADEPGRKHAQQVAASLAGKAASIKVLELPGAKDLHEWAATKDGTRDELLRLIANAPAWTAQPLAWRQVFKSLDEMEQGEMRFLVDRILPEGVTLIGALSGAGKTWVALSITRALTTGRKFLGNYVVPEPVDVIYLIPEAGERTFRKRMELMGINRRFLCQTMKDGVMKLDDPQLLAAVHDLKPVVFLDTAIRFSEADNENDASQNAGGLAMDIFGLLRAGARGVVGLHHRPKSSAQQEMTLENVLRGSGDLGAMCDAVYGLRVVNPEMLEISVECVKPRDFDPVPAFRIQGRPYINEMGDFAMLAEPGLPSQQAEEVKLAKAITANPAASYRELAEQTGIVLNRIARVATKIGWKKVGPRWVNTALQTSLVN